jgi:hypothetical protein
MVIGNLSDNLGKNWSCKWEAEPFLSVAINPFASSDDQFNSGIAKGADFKPELEVNALEGGNIIPCRRWFGVEHDVGKQVGDRGDGGWEWWVALEVVEGFV